MASAFDDAHTRKAPPLPPSVTDADLKARQGYTTAPRSRTPSSITSPPSFYCPSWHITTELTSSLAGDLALCSRESFLAVIVQVTEAACDGNGDVVSNLLTLPAFWQPKRSSQELVSLLTADIVPEAERAIKTFLIRSVNHLGVLQDRCLIVTDRALYRVRYSREHKCAVRVSRIAGDEVTGIYYGAIVGQDECGVRVFTTEERSTQVKLSDLFDKRFHAFNTFLPPFSSKSQLVPPPPVHLTTRDLIS